MSALGQKQTCAVQKRVSALPPKADMCGATSDVCYGPIADMGRLRSVYELISDCQHGRWDGETKLFCST